MLNFVNTLNKSCIAFHSHSLLHLGIPTNFLLNIDTIVCFEVINNTTNCIILHVILVRFEMMGQLPLNLSVWPMLTNEGVDHSGFSSIWPGRVKLKTKQQ